jgi:hypothetical protein
MKKLKRLIIVLGAVALLASTAVIADARDDEPDEPTPEVIREYAFAYMKQFPQKMSDRDIANQLASTIYWLEKIQLVCPSYFHVNARRVRFSYLLRQGTWAMMFGPGKTSTSILNENNARRNQEFNNTVSKREWCEGIKAFGIKTFSWDDLFEADK